MITPAQHYAIQQDLSVIACLAKYLPNPVHSGIDTTRWLHPSSVHNHPGSPSEQSLSDLDALEQSMRVHFIHGRFRAWQWTLADHKDWSVPEDLQDSDDMQLDTLQNLAIILMHNIPILEMDTGIEWKAEEIRTATTALETLARSGRLIHARNLGR